MSCLQANSTDKYDSTAEPVIPRNFYWDVDFDYRTADNTSIINGYLSGLDYRNNQFLSSPETMIEEGFKGTPYKY